LCWLPPSLVVMILHSSSTGTPHRLIARGLSSCPRLLLAPLTEALRFKCCTHPSRSNRVYPIYVCPGSSHPYSPVASHVARNFFSSVRSVQQPIYQSRRMLILSFDCLLFAGIFIGISRLLICVVNIFTFPPLLCRTSAALGERTCPDASPAI